MLGSEASSLKFTEWYEFLQWFQKNAKEYEEFNSIEKHYLLFGDTE